MLHIIFLVALKVAPCAPLLRNTRCPWSGCVHDGRWSLWAILVGKELAWYVQMRISRPTLTAHSPLYPFSWLHTHATIFRFRITEIFTLKISYRHGNIDIYMDKKSFKILPLKNGMHLLAYKSVVRWIILNIFLVVTTC